MSVYTSAAVAEWAKGILREHDLAEGGWWCKGCYRDGNVRIAAGKCGPHQEAQAVCDRLRRRPPSRPASRPGERFWFKT